ncbi:MAG: aminoacyl-tRNA hydrolase [Oscillospiraceae bacterium]|nr:aminoacyl-tRNA hydrolase [Oscillospiraceae bacterium]
MFFLNKIRRRDFNSAQSAPKLLIVGLGNPGTRYENTRHNCGFMAVDTLAEQEGFKLKKLKFKSLTALETIDGMKCFIMKPTTFMNRSGEAVAAAMEFYKIKTENLIVVFDDYSLPLGTVKIRRSGSDGGHNGIKSIILETGSDAFPRAKIGIDRPSHPGFPLKDWVLSPFKKDEGGTLEASLESAVCAVRLMIKHGVDRAMNDFNGKT